MHEALLTRGDVQGLNLELRQLIFVPENCVLVGNVCHDVAATKDGQLVCARNLVVHEGAKNILNWLDSMGMYLPASLIDSAKHLIDEVSFGEEVYA